MKWLYPRSLPVGCLCWLALTGPLAAQAPAYQDRIVAKVNGKPVFEIDAFRPIELERVPEAEREAWRRERIDRAIDFEVLYQRARADAVDQEPAFVEILTSADAMMTGRDAEVLAAYYQTTIDSLAKAADPATLTDAEMAAHQQSHARLYRNHKGDRLRELLRIDTLAKRVDRAYAAWFKEVVDAVPVLVNEAGIDPGLLKAAVDLNRGIVPIPDAGLASLPVAGIWTALLTAAGIDEKELIAAAEKDNQKATDVVIDKARAVVVKTGETPSALFVDQLGMALMNGLVNDPAFMAMEITMGLEPLMIAELARRTGAAESAAYVQYLRARRAADRSANGYDGAGWPAWRHRHYLVDYFVRLKGMPEAGPAPVTQAEVDDFETAFPARYEELARKPYGPQQRQTIIRRMLERDHQQSARQSFIAGLRRQAEVAYVD